MEGVRRLEGVRRWEGGRRWGGGVKTVEGSGGRLEVGERVGEAKGDFPGGWLREVREMGV